ncbi:MAG: autotransporter outer membrane beta-barrel domain-containing protein [Elusimicrobiota bacterium]|nr:autotransporter outer membrane beta-barrel domain-containing protein [Elusimicrobiota bacterium]
MSKVKKYFKLAIVTVLLLFIKIHSFGIVVPNWNDFVTNYQNGLSGSEYIVIGGNPGFMKAGRYESLGLHRLELGGIIGSASNSTIDGNSFYAGMNLSTGTSSPFYFSSLNIINFIKSENNFSYIKEETALYRGAAIFISSSVAGASQEIIFESTAAQTSFNQNNQFTGNRVIFNNDTSTQVAGGAIFASVVVDNAVVDNKGSIFLNFRKRTDIADSAYLGFSNNFISVRAANSQGQGGALYVSGRVNTSDANQSLGKVVFSTVSANGNNSGVNRINNNYVLALGTTSQAQGGAFFAAGTVVNGNVVGNGGYTEVAFYASDMIFDSNYVRASGINSQAQGGGLFFAGAVGNHSADIFVNNTSTISFHGSTISFQRNYIQTTANNIQAQGAGVFFVGMTSLSGSVSTATVNISFNYSNINFTQNFASVYSYSQAQGGGLFIAAGISGAQSKFKPGLAEISLLSFNGDRININANTLTSNGSYSQVHGAGLFIGADIAFGQNSRIDYLVKSSVSAEIKYSTFSLSQNTANIYGGSFSQAAGAGAFLAAITASESGAITSMGNDKKTMLFNFYQSTLAVKNNTINASNNASQGLGGGLFIAANVAGGRDALANDGYIRVSFDSSTVAIEGNTINQGSSLSQNLGGGLFIGGVVAGGSGEGESGPSSANNGIANVSFYYDKITINNNNKSIDSPSYSQNMGGGIFIGGAIAGGNKTQAKAGEVNVSFTSSTLQVRGNRASLGGGIFVGGAISGGQNTLADNGEAAVSFTSSIVTIENNAAYKGGGLYASPISQGGSGSQANNGSVQINFRGSTVTFSGNTAASGLGSAIYAEKGAQITFEDGRIEFINNGIANVGRGVVFWDGASKVDFYSANNLEVIAHLNKAALGGFLYLENENITFNGIVKISSNSAVYGGAIYLSNGARLTFNNDVSIKGNIAQYGSAVYFKENSQIIFKGENTEISSNSSQGGIFQWETKNIPAIEFSGNVNIIGNFANQSGSFLNLSEQNATIRLTNLQTARTVSFSKNRSAGYGGVIFASNNSTVILENAAGSTVGNQIIFGTNTNRNTAPNDIHLEDSHLIIRGFADNNAQFLGGIYAKNSSVDWSAAGQGRIVLGGYNYFENSSITSGNTLKIQYSTFVWTNSKVLELSTDKLSVENTRFEFTNNPNGAFHITNNSVSGVVSDKDSTFVFFNNYNTGDGVFSSENQSGGVAVFRSNLTATGNSVGGSGGFFSVATRDDITFGYSEISINISGNKANKNGGAVHLFGKDSTYSTKITFTGDSILFFNNTAGQRGGAVFATENSSATFSNKDTNNILFGNIVFFSNRQNSAGLASPNASSNDIYISSGATLTLEASTVSILSGLYSLNNSIIIINTNRMNMTGYNYFDKTKFNYIGGDIQIVNTEFTYNNSQGFDLPNLGQTVWQTYNQKVSLNFSNSYVRFINNEKTILTANLSPAAQNNASASFNNSIVYFANNKNTDNNPSVDIRGAIVTNNSLSMLKFSNSSIYFSNNITSATSSSLNAAARGGAISIYQASTVSFSGANVSFTSNKASGADPDSGGGAIFLQDAFVNNANNTPTLLIDRSNISFINNETTGYGGAILTGDLNVTNHPTTESGHIWVGIKNSNLTFSGNKASVGGAIAVGDLSKMNISNTPVMFSNNSALNGGAVAVVGERPGTNNAAYISSLTFINSPVTFNQNTSAQNGGALYVHIASLNGVQAEGNIIFQGGNANFTNNISLSSGGAMYIYAGQNAGGGIIRFTQGNTAIFSNNSAIAGGAAALITKSHLIFDRANAVFSNNSAEYGGAIYGEYHVPSDEDPGLNNDTDISFNNSNIVFSGNRAQYGAVMYLKGQDSAGSSHINKYTGVHFSGGNITFINNISSGNNSRGIISFDYDGSNNSFSTITFSNNVNVKALNNRADLGGFLYLTGDNTGAGDGLVFDGNVEISGNKAEKGAALYLAASGSGKGAHITFRGNVIINNNITTGDNSSETQAGGGAIYMENSSDILLNFSNVNSLTAMGNTAVGNGGFLFAYGKTGANAVTFGGNNINISNNIAQKGSGGAIALYSSELNINTPISARRGNVVFNGNSASGFGGAIFANMSNISLKAQNGNIIFNGNKQEGQNRANDIYLIGNSVLSVLAGNNSSIIINSGLIGTAGTQISAKSSAPSGKTIIRGNINFAGLVNVEGNGKIYMAGNSGVESGKYAGRAMYISTITVNAAAGTFGVGSPDSLGLIRALIDKADISNGGALEIVVNASNRTYGQVVVSSFISVSSVTGARLRLNVNNNGWVSGKAIVFAGNENMIKNDTWYAGAFGFDDSSIDQYTKVISLSQDDYYGYTGGFEILRHKDFTDLHNLSQNQREIGKSISNSKWKSDPEAEALVKSIRIAIADRGSDYGKEVLDSLSGSFLANVLKLGATQYNSAALYSRMNESARENQNGDFEDSIYDTLWLQPSFRNIHYNENDENPRAFNADGYGMQAGTDMILGDNLIGGLFVNFNMNNLSQGEDRGSMTEIGVGAFGGIYGEKINAKAGFIVAQQAFSTRRKVIIQSSTQGNDYKKEATADFNSYSVNLGGEAEYIINIGDETDLRPFAGLQNTAVFNDEIKERSGDLINLKIEEDKYLRSDLSIGVKVGDSGGNFKWYGKTYLGYIIVGNSKEYEISFQNDNMGGGRRGDVRSYDEKRIFAGIGGGTEWNVNNDVSLYANVESIIGNDNYGYFATIGVNFKYGGRDKIRDR